MVLTLLQAAEKAAISTTAILADIDAGHLRLVRRWDGCYGVDPDDLFRLYPPQRSATDSSAGAPSSEMLELRMMNAELRMQIATLKLQLESERERADALIADRDRRAAIATTRAA